MENLFFGKRKIKIYFFLLFIIGCCCAFPQLHAQSSTSNKQFFDKINITKEQRKLPHLPISVKKDRYRVDVLLPVDGKKYLTNGSRNHVRMNPMTAWALNFYNGLRMAAKEMDKVGIKMDLYIHDVGDSGALSSLFLKDKSLLSSDLMIGFLPSEQVAEVARVAARREINFISAFSPSDAQVFYNPYFILLQPTLETHIQKLVEFAQQRYPHHVSVLLYDNQTPLEQKAKVSFEDMLKKADYTGISVSDFLNNPEMLISHLYDRQTNVLYVNLLSAKRAALVLKELETLSEKYRLAVFGMPTWKYIKGISNFSERNNLEIYFSSPFYYDLQSPKAAQFSQQYKADFGGMPSDMAFRGYETLLWASNLLSNYGTSFNKNIQDSRTTPFTRFQVKPVWSKNEQFRYFDNQQLYIFLYQNGYFNLAE